VNEKYFERNIINENDNGCCIEILHGFELNNIKFSGKIIDYLHSDLSFFSSKTEGEQQEVYEKLTAFFLFCLQIFQTKRNNKENKNIKKTLFSKFL